MLPNTMTIDPRIASAAAAVFDRLPGGSLHLARSAQWMRSVAVREVMARLLAPHADYESLRESVRAGTAARPVDAAAAWQWVHVALAIGQQQLEPSDVDDAIAMFDLARSVLPASQWATRDAQGLAQLMWSAGRSGEIDSELLKRLPPGEREFLEIDLIGLSQGIASAPWIDALNAALTSRGVAPIGLNMVGATMFDRLGSTEARAAVSGPLVSVVMSAYRPGPEILTAVRSILDQTWAELELLVVDDASGHEFDDTFDCVAALDSRVQVLRQPVNRGTYAARNWAMRVSAGEFITFQDADDWSHPERIELQVQPLVEEPALLRTHSQSVRASTDLIFQCSGYKVMRANASSHLFRRSVLDRLGGFDRVRKGADTEFDLRVEAAFPERGLVLTEPLAFVRLDPTSLSRADFVPGWWRSDRAEYRDAMRHWHRAIESGADPLLTPELVHRPLTAPRAFLRDTGVELTDPETLALADWTMDDALHRTALDHMRGHLKSARGVGLVQVRSLRGYGAPGSERLSRAARLAIASTEAQVVSPEDQLHVPEVVVWQPDVLQFPTSLPVGISADRVEIVDDGCEGVHWSRGDVERVAVEWFGVEPTWRTDPALDIDPVLLRTPRNRFRAHRPVVGWIAEADGSDLPNDSAAMLQAYPAGEEMDIRLVGVRRALSLHGIAADRSWLLHEPGDVTAREFWHQVDFAVAAPSNPRRRALERTVGEALAAGCVVVLQPASASWFGDAVVAAELADMAAVVHRLRGDRDTYVEQLERGRLWARTRLAS